MKKTCFKCGEEKDVSEFYKQKKMKDGYLGKCRKCTKKDVSQHRAENLESIQAYDRKRGNLPHRVRARAEYAKTKKGQAALNRGQKKWGKKHPLQKAASTIVTNAVRDGRLKKEPCSVCGSVSRIHGHHEDYYKPLDVIWLCPKHHSELHKKKRGKNEST